MNYKAIFLIAAILSMTVLIPINSANATMTVPNPTQFTELTLGGPQTLDPNAAYDTASSEIIFNILPALCYFDFVDTNRFIPWLSDYWPGYGVVEGNGILPLAPKQWVFSSAVVNPANPIYSHWTRYDKIDALDYVLGEWEDNGNHILDYCDNITFKFIPCNTPVPIYAWTNTTNFNPSSPVGSTWTDGTNNYIITVWEDNGNGYLDFCDFISAYCSNTKTYLYHVETLTLVGNTYTLTLKAARTAKFHVHDLALDGLYYLVLDPLFIEETWYFHINPNFPWQGTGFGNVTGYDMEYSIERGMVMDISGGPQWMFYSALLASGTSRSYNVPWRTSVSNPYNPLLPDDVGYLGWRIDNAIETNGTWVWFNLAAPFAPFQQILCQTWASPLCKEWLINMPPETTYGQRNWNASWHVTPGDYNTWGKFCRPKLPGPLGFAEQSTTTPKFIGSAAYYLDYVDSATGYWRLKSFASAGMVDWTKPHIDIVIHEVVLEWATRKERFLSNDPDTQADMVTIERLYTQDPDLLAAEADGRVRYMTQLPTLQADALFFAYDILDDSVTEWVPKLGGVANKTLLSDRYMRLGLIYSFNVTEYIDADFFGEAVPLHDPIIYGIAYSNETKHATMYYNINVAKATWCFKMAWGGSDPTPMNLDTGYDSNTADEVPGDAWNLGFDIPIEPFPPGPIREDPILSMKAVIENLISPTPGWFTIEDNALAWDAGLNALYSGQLNCFMLGWIVDFPDPNDWDVPFMSTYGDFSGFQNIHYGDGTLNWNSKGNIKGFPYTNWKGDTIHSINNTYVDGLIASGISFTDPATRQKIYTEEEDIFYAEAGTEMMEQPSARHYERVWVQGWFYSAIYYGLMFYGPGTAMRLWKEDPATVYRSVGATARMELGGSWHKYVTVKNLGEIPEFIDLYEQVSASGHEVESHYIEFWLNPGQEYDFEASGSDTGPITVTLTIERSRTYLDPMCTYQYAGDVGSRIGSTNTWFVFDFAVTSTDLQLLRTVYKGYDTDPNHIWVSDVGSRVVSTNLYFVFDGQVTSADLQLLRVVYKGLGGPPNP